MTIPRFLYHVEKPDSMLLYTFDSSGGFYVRETISDMYAYSGVLYALSYKQVGKGVPILPFDDLFI